MKCSVVLACFDGEKYIRDQLLSIIDSLNYARVLDFEIIISDDGSTDDTLHIINSILDERIKLLEGPKKGLIKNFEYALKECSGEFIFLCDQDDVWFREKVKVCLENLDDSDLVISDAIVVNKNLITINESFFDLNKSRPGIVKNIIKNSYLGCALAFKRDVLEMSLPFPDNIAMHDWWIGLIANSFFKVSFINQPLFYYRRHGQNASVTSEKSKYPFKLRLVWRLNILTSLFSQYWKNKI